MTNFYPNVQYHLRPGIIELKAGHPDLALLPAEGLLQAAQKVLQEEASQALSYGAEQGPGRLLEPLAAWLNTTSSSSSQVDIEQLFITGGTSQALGMLCLLLTQPGDLALVQSPTYHLALRILHEDYHLELLPIPSDAHGLMDIAALEDRLLTLERQGRPPRLLYLVPTFGNPSGTTLSLAQRMRLITLAERYQFLILEDDPYCRLWYERPPPPSLYSLAPTGRVIRLESFSKILAPGLRLGWMLAAPEIVQRCVMSGVLDSGGGVNHWTAHIAAAFLGMGLLDWHIQRLRETYRTRCNCLDEALSASLPPDCQWNLPQGGFYLWLRLPPTTDSRALLSKAEAAGVSYLPGNLFFPEGDGQEFCRLNFTMFAEAELAEGARRLGNVLFH